MTRASYSEAQNALSLFLCQRIRLHIIEWNSVVGEWLRCARLIATTRLLRWFSVRSTFCLLTAGKRVHRGGRTTLDCTLRRESNSRRVPASFQYAASQRTGGSVIQELANYGCVLHCLNPVALTAD